MKGSLSSCGKASFHYGNRLIVFCGFLFFKYSVISSTVAKAGETLPFFISVRAFARRASMIRRWAGVYSSSAVGNVERSVICFGRRMNDPRLTVTSRRSPSATPTRSRRAVGSVTWPFFWILMMDINVECY